VSEVRIVERDYEVFRAVERWRVVLGRHIAELAGFTGLRSCDQRLKKLCDAGYIERKKILYGVPSIYQNTHKAKLLASLPARSEKIRVEQIPHDIAVLDTAIFFHRTKGIPWEAITSEKQLHSLDGFGTRKHRPDFVIKQEGKSYCVEVELSLKAKARLEGIIQANFMDYDFQIWIVPDKACKIYQILEDNRKQYPNMYILELPRARPRRQRGRLPPLRAQQPPPQPRPSSKRSRRSPSTLRLTMLKSSPQSGPIPKARRSRSYGIPP